MAIQGRTKYLASRSPATLTQADTEQAIAEEEDSPLLRYLVNDLKVVSGLTPFWKMKRQQLKAMSDVLGPPHLFLTLTAANHEWTSLLRLLPDIIPASTLAEIRTAVIRNPHIRKFDVKEMWLRYEYQSTGAVYAHALSWSHNAPPYRNPDDPNYDQAQDTNSLNKIEPKPDATTSNHYSGSELTGVLNSNDRRVILASSIVRHVTDQKEYHGQEICHQILGHPLVESTKGLVIIGCRPAAEQSEVRGKTLLERYLERHTRHETMTLHDFATRYDYKNGMVRLPKPRTPLFIPRYPVDTANEDCCRAKMMLRHEFRDSVDSLLTAFPPHVFTNFVDLFNWCRDTHPHPAHTLPFDTLDSRKFRHTDYQDEAVEKDWRVLVNKLSETAFQSDLGTRPIDLAQVWPVATYQNLNPRFWSSMPRRPLIPANMIGPDAALTLNREQQQAHHKVMQHFQALLNGAPNLPPFHVQIDGASGTGKTYLINVISFHMESLSKHMGRGNPVLRIAPTGGAACEITGNTIHSGLRIPVGRAFEPLSDGDCTEMRHDYSSVELIIIDEKSMVDLYLLARVDARCRQLWDSEEFFGGKCAILAGDFAQLCSVIGKPLFATRGLTDEEVEWRKVSMALLSPADIRQFDDAIRIYNTNRQVDLLNHSRMRSANLPVLRIDATGSGQNWDQAASDESGELELTLFLSIGTRIMLIDNLSTATGAKNGTTGVVRHIEYATGKKPRQDLPQAILVELNGYTGPTIAIAGGYNVVPIFPVTRRYMFKGVHCTRTQFPLTISYAINVYSSQGITITGKAVYDISRRNWAHGLIYTALSRVKRLDSIMLEVPSGRERFATTVAEREETSYLHQRKLDELHRSHQLWW
ncbi:hypothetical protein D6C97_04457 [Aureobasidium pullulans]|nr:hypothetical protein D6C97_04457 [Aureobasidium pullulans]